MLSLSPIGNTKWKQSGLESGASAFPCTPVPCKILHNVRRNVEESKTKATRGRNGVSEAALEKEQEIWLFFMLNSLACVGPY